MSDDRHCGICGTEDYDEGNCGVCMTGVFKATAKTAPTMRALLERAAEALNPFESFSMTGDDLRALVDDARALLARIDGASPATAIRPSSAEWRRERLQRLQVELLDAMDVLEQSGEERPAIAAYEAFEEAMKHIDGAGGGT